MKASFGTGPRDSVMVVLARKTKMSVGLCRGIIELSVTLVGWLMGGMVGVGTLIYGFAVGFAIQLVFYILKFDATKVKHETIKETCGTFWRALRK